MYRGCLFNLKAGVRTPAELGFFSMYEKEISFPREIKLIDFRLSTYELSTFVCLPISRIFLTVSKCYGSCKCFLIVVSRGLEILMNWIFIRLNWCLLKDCRLCFRFMNFAFLLILNSTILLGAFFFYFLSFFNFSQKLFHWFLKKGLMGIPLNSLVYFYSSIQSTAFEKVCGKIWIFFRFWYFSQKLPCKIW